MSRLISGSKNTLVVVPRAGVLVESGAAASVRRIHGTDELENAVSLNGTSVGRPDEPGNPPMMAESQAGFRPDWISR